jgi:hypothetical protein
MVRATVCVVALGLLLCAAGAATATIRVNWNGSADYTTIQAGMDAAATGDTVVVASGTYYITDPISYGGKEILLHSEFNPESTIIDCQNVTNAVLFDGEGEDAKLLGFTIRNGNASYGGAINCVGGAAPMISGCVIENCTAVRGGGLYVHSSPVTVLDTEITGCEGSEFGGGIYCFDSSGASFMGLVIGENTGGEGGGFYAWGGAPTIQISTFYRNSGPGGGAIHARGSNPMILQSILSFSTSGKAIDCEDGAVPYIGYCDIYGNAGGDDLCGTLWTNWAEDPRFCDIDGGDVRLCANSWCLPGGGNPMTALIGACGQGCDACGAPVAGTTWGGVKALYR